MARFQRLSELSFVSKVWNIKCTENWILESTIVVPNFPIYFSSFLFSSANGALESQCYFRLHKKMLKGANPFDTAHEVQTAHFKTSGTLAILVHLLDLQIFLGFKQEKPILHFSIFSHQSRGLRAKNAAQVMGQGNFNPKGGFHGLGTGPDIACIVVSVSVPELSPSCCSTLYVDLVIFFTAVFCTSFGTGSDLELSFVFLSMIHTLLKQLKVSIPTRGLKSRPAILISRTQRSYS